MTTLTIFAIITISCLILACFDYDPIDHMAGIKQPRNRKGQWTKKALPLQITRVQRPRFRRLDERTWVRV
jgi:hypothetical protein